MKPERLDIIEWIGTLAMLLGITMRMVVAYEPMPHWQVDATSILSPLTGYGPAELHLLDLLCIVGAAAILCVKTLARERVNVPACSLAAIGAVFVLLHDGDLEHLRIGSTWIAAIASAIGFMHLRTPRVRQVAIAVMLGVVGMLAVKGLLQIFVELPDTTAMYYAQRERMLGASGWTPGTDAARNYERRLSQLDATGWFGLSNIYAAVVGACLVAIAGLSAGAWSQTRQQKASVISTNLYAAAASTLILTALALWYAHSKGGMTAVALGLAVVIAGTLAIGRDWSDSRRIRIGRLCALGGVTAALLAIAIRGAIGTGLSELSILFRWFYIEGSVRIIASNPLTGVGPAGFKDAYLLAKPPLSPEEVASPHSIFFDWIASLGLGGLAWSALLIMLLWLIGSAMWRQRARDESESAFPLKPDVLIIFAVAGIAALAANSVESEAATIEAALSRLAGLGTWVGIGTLTLVIIRASSAAAPLALGAAAIAIAAHAQIEMSPIWPTSAPWILGIIGLAAGVSHIPAKSDDSTKPSPPMIPAACALGALLLAIITALPAPTIRSWQSHLGEAARIAEPAALIKERLSSLATGVPLYPGDTSDRVQSDLADLLGTESAAPDSPQQALARVDLRLGTAAALALERAIAEYPYHPPTNRAIIRLERRLAYLAADQSQPDTANSHLDRAKVAAERLIAGPIATAAGHAMLASVAEDRARITGDPAPLNEAIVNLEAASAIDPYSPDHAARLATLYREIGDSAAARTWAQQALNLSDLRWLDPLRQFDDAKRREMERIAGSGG